jgi:ectoine hydroxylase-related dioxygenase (phytanoyl-CoA dioxygenase family)
MNYDWAFLPMVASNDLLGDRDALRARLDRDGYLYLSQVIDREKVLRLRQRMLVKLRDCGWVEPALLKLGRTARRPVREGDPEFFVGYDEIQKLEELHTLAHDENLMSVMRDVLGDTAFPHPLKIARLIFPDHHEVSTPPHQDYPNNQGTPNLTATWIPVGDIPPEVGGLAILRGSHRFGVQPLTTHFGAGNRSAVLPIEMLEECRWVTTQFSAGDVLVFPAMTVHAALHNASGFFMRLSIDFRYQLEGEALTPGCLEPHFGHLSWDEIYAKWSSTKYQYYWRDLDYEVVPFDDYDIVRTEDENDEVARFIAYERRLDKRFQREDVGGGRIPGVAEAI